MTLIRGEGDNRWETSQRMDIRYKAHDFMRDECIRQDRLKEDQAQDLRIRDLQANFKVYTEKIKGLMGEIEILPDNVKNRFRKAKREYQKLKHDFSDVFIFASPDQLTMRPTYYLNPRLPDLERSARKANEDRLRDAVNQISPFHQELSCQVKVARDQPQQDITKESGDRHALQEQNTGLQEQIIQLQRESGDRHALQEQNTGLQEQIIQLQRESEDRHALQEQNAELQEQIRRLQENLAEQHKKTINLLIPSISEKLKHIYPLRYISTTLLKEPIRRTLGDDSDHSPVEKFFACCRTAFHIRYTAQRSLKLTGEERRKIIEKSLLEVKRELDRTLENAEKDLRSKLCAKAEETFNTIDEVRQYWESHKEEMINMGLTKEMYEKLESNSITLSTEYFEERVEFSPSSPTETVRTTNRTTKRTPEAEGLLDRIKKILPDEPHRAGGELESPRSDLLEKLKNDFSQLDRNWTTVSKLKEFFLDYEKKKLNGMKRSPGFVAKVNSLREDWKQHQGSIKAVFGQNVYEDKIPTLETIAERNYSSKEMTLELAEEIAIDNTKIWNIEVILNYAKDRADKAWLKQPEDPQDDQKLVEATTAKFDNLEAGFVQDLINKARSLDQWVRSNDPRITPDVVEKIGQLLTQAHHDFDFVLTPRREGAEQGRKPSSSQQQNLNRTIDLWDNYRQKKGRQPPIYLGDLRPEERNNANLFLIDPSKLTQRLQDPSKACTTEEMKNMQKNRNEQLNKLQVGLEKKWTSLLENNPNLKRLFHGFSPRNFWRLCIDKKCQREDSISSSDAINDNMLNDPEPYFLVGTMRGLVLTLTQLGKKLTPEYYQLLQYHIFKDSIIVRSKKENLTSERGSLGFRSPFISYKKGAPIILKASPVIPHTQGCDEIGRYYKNRHSSDSYYHQGHPVGRCIAVDPHQTRDSYTIACLTEGETKANLQCVFDKYYNQLDRVRSNIAVQRGCREWSDDLALNLSKEETEKIIAVIAECYKELDLGHFLWDGNGRMVNFCIVNKLLLENGLSPAIMEPHCPHDDKSKPRYGLAWKPIKQIVAVIRGGQALFESYKQPETGSANSTAEEKEV